MSVKIMTMAWQVQLPHTEKLVLLALADNANDEGDCWPSITTIATKCGMNRRTVMRVLDALEQKRQITRSTHAGQTNSYRVHPWQGVTSDRESLVAERHGGSDTQPRVLVAHSHGGSDSVPPRTVIEPSIEPSGNRQKKRAKSPASQSVDEPPPPNLNVEAWHRWVQYRSSIRKPFKPVSIPAAQRQLAGYGPDQEAVVEQSIANGWVGLFPLKTGRAATPGLNRAEAREQSTLDAAREFLGVNHGRS